MDELVPTRVEAYCGGRGEEEPRALEIDGRRLEIDAIEGRWQEPEGRFFRVRAVGRSHVLFCRTGDLSWWLRVSGE